MIHYIHYIYHMNLLSKIRALLLKLKMVEFTNIYDS